MAGGLLSLQERGSTVINLRSVLHKDLLPWSGAFLLVLVLNVCMVGVIGSATTSADTFNFSKASAHLYQQGIPLYVLALLGCFLARRSKSTWTWVVAGLIIILFTPQINMTLAILLFPNSTLPMMVGMIGLLAAGRLVEYLHTKYIIQLEELSLTNGVLIAYISIVFVAIVMNSAILFSIFTE